MAALGTLRDGTLPDTSAVAEGAAFGLYPASDFRLTDGRCQDCPTIRQALWYFQRETIAVAKPGRSIASFSPGVSTADDLREWLALRDPAAPPEYPPLVWVAAPHVVSGAWLSANATSLDSPDGPLHATLTPKLALNRSYFDATSAEFLSRRTLKVRGTIEGNSIVMRTLWPEEFRLDRAPPVQQLATGKDAPLALRALMRAEPAGGALSPFATSTLWQRDQGSDAVPPGSSVLALMINGAQGDDDEAHGGHFALVTGRTREDGAIGDWLVNNFYTLDSESEKGILAAPVPLDNYLADLNSGQNWYRPSQLLVLVLADDRAAALVQAALNRVYNQFWRHQLVYRHATMNCAGISVDVLRSMGWPIPKRSPASRIVAALGLPYFAARERSLSKARIAFDYLNEDQTRLMPAAAFEECGAAALELVRSGAAQGSGLLARMLAEDVETIAFVRLPQFPSSRAVGNAPVVTPWEFQSRMPSDPLLKQVIPVPPRPFPEKFRDPDLIDSKRHGSHYATAIWGAVLVTGLVSVLFTILKQWSS